VEGKSVCVLHTTTWNLKFRYITWLARCHTTQNAEFVCFHPLVILCFPQSSSYKIAAAFCWLISWFDPIEWLSNGSRTDHTARCSAHYPIRPPIVTRDENSCPWPRNSPQTNDYRNTGLQQELRKTVVTCGGSNNRLRYEYLTKQTPWMRILIDKLKIALASHEIHRIL
jgi:hypothetical protein